MRIEPVEIYSDASNLAVMRHPGRQYPGILIQGDSLYVLSQRLDQLCETLRGRIGQDEFEELGDLRDELRGRLDHYRTVLTDHGIRLPFGGP